MSCESRICTSCGKKYADVWAEKLAGSVFSVKHRHVILTIPAQLRGYLRDWKLLKALMDAAGELMQEFIAQKWRRSEAMAGVICVLHTYGSDMHVLATEGGLDKKQGWRRMKFFPAKKLRNMWQYVLLTKLKESLPAELVDYLFKRYSKGFYVYTKYSLISAKKIGSYIARYVRHPAIAERRIKGYDGAKVTFEYKDYKLEKKVEKEMSVPEFISQLLAHIPEKHFRMVRYYGIYARNKKALVHKIMEKLGKVKKGIEAMISRVVESLRVRCRVCGAVMEMEGVYLPT